MIPIVAPLKSDDRKPEVSNLQEGLLLLIDRQLLTVPAAQLVKTISELTREREAQVYARFTSSTVQTFQQQYAAQFHLHISGKVDEETAKALNQLLQQIGAFTDSPTKDEWVVRGQVVDASGPVNDIQVSIFDRDLFFRRDGAITSQHLGTEITKKHPIRSEEGCFELAYATERFATGDIEREGENIPDLIFTVSKEGKPLEKFQIYRLADGEGLKEESLVTDDDLILGIEARRLEEVRIVIPGGEPKRELSEYERVIQAIAPLLQVRTPLDVTDAARLEAIVGDAVRRLDEENHRDISFVARETRLDRLLVEALVSAFRLAADPFESQLPASVFYGLARTEAASDVLSLARLSTEDLRLALKNATSDIPSIIPPFNPENRLEEAVQVIRNMLAKHVPNYRSAEGGPSLADLVGADLSDPADQATLWRNFSDHEGAPAEFWEKLQAQPGFGDRDKITRLKYRFQLGMLTQNNIPLVNAIRAKHPRVASTSELAFELDTQGKWIDLLDSAAIPIPDNVPGGPDERKANYAANLAEAMQVAHPTVAVANMVASLPPVQLANTQAAVAKFLADAVRQTQFDLVAGRITDLVEKHGDTLLKDIASKNRPVVIDQVKRLQRLFRLSTGPESLRALIEAGFTSAREVAELPREVAMDVLTPTVGEVTAKIIINRAHNISTAAIHQYVLLHDALHGDMVGGAI